MVVTICPPEGHGVALVQYLVDSAAQEVIDRYGIAPESIESALDLAQDYERRIKFQADLQDYVEQSISSTIKPPLMGHRVEQRGHREAIRGDPRPLRSAPPGLHLLPRRK